MHLYRSNPSFRISLCEGFGLLDLMRQESPADYSRLLAMMKVTWFPGGITIYSDEKSVCLQVIQIHDDPYGAPIQDLLISQQWRTTLGILGLSVKILVSGTPKVVYVGSPLSRLLDCIFYIKKVRVGIGIAGFADVRDYRFRSELELFLGSQYDHVHSVTAHDYSTMPYSSWDALFNLAMSFIS